MSKYIPPGNADSPRRNWSITKVLVEGGEGDMAIALGKWDGEDVIGLRWNGDADRPIGNPQSRGLPTWFIMEKGRYADAIIDALRSEADRNLVRNFIPRSSK